MSFPKISELHPQVIEWAKSRFLATAKPLQQMAVTWEEIQEADEALCDYQCTKQAYPNMIADERAVWINAAATELGDVLVTLCIGAHLQGTTLDQCMAMLQAGGNPERWEFVDDWASALQGELESHQYGNMSAQSLVGAVARCVEEAARVQLAMFPGECLQMALTKISQRKGATNPKTGKWEKVA